VSDQIPPGSTVTMRLENVTAKQAIDIIAQSKGLIVKELNNVTYVKTAAEQEKEPTESGNYQFSYAQVAKPEALTVTAAAVGGEGAATAAGGGQMTSGSTVMNTELLALIKSQLHSGLDPQFDLRTNTVFFRETISNFDNFKRFLVSIDRPTKQVMIEARLVEVTANPKQAYGINWAGVVGSADSPKTVSYGTNVGGFTLPSSNNNIIGNFGDLAQGAFAILSVPQMSLTLQALNEDSDAEFLANPRIVTADNLPAKIQIVRAQPVPEVVPGGVSADGRSLPPSFNSFKDKIFGNTLLVRPSVNKDSFVTLSVKPEISNKVTDQPFRLSDGTTVFSPVIDTRSLESNVLIKSGDTLAIGGLIQDEISKGRTKVPVVGDIPVLGYLFQSRSNARVKRNLLVFVTPTILDPHYGTGLEDQISGLHHSGEEYADPNGWRNNARGAVRVVPTSHRQTAADYPKPGIPPAPAKTGGSRVRFMTDAKGRDF
jgi:type II secretory pathway component GspD/PulD (secretin)